ncbi:UvrD-helicase domain-containing protein [Dokdonella fugitiva]|uniref:RecBCD enzyme subunit RecB n=1 Tax=Dokdonella fugitiva TaxID=328517 RepID=A0A4R2IBH2_9GAMM|nr:UvrD-helicase domain-containing protein [Dokdonella fugitiva]TCO41864.1 exodeoxyribonuclease V beta subunit [Dokdonella fugitiva]
MMPTPVHAPLQPLDWRTMALDGRALIEASAGTGKTWSIGLVYLRLLLERDVGVDRILVATFTVAAAQELRERLRQRIVQAEQWLQGHVDGAHDAAMAESPLDAYLRECCSEAGWAERALRRMRVARADIDRAPISTIHALCQRIQRDFPLESGAAFGEERLVVDEDLRRECVEDFWRRRYLDDALDTGEDAVLFRDGPEGLLRDLGTIAASGDAWIEPDGLAAIGPRVERIATAGNVEELRRLAGDERLYDGRKRALAERLQKVAAVLEAAPVSPDALADTLDEYFTEAKIEQQQSATAPLRLREHPLVRELLALRGMLRARTTLARGIVLAAAAEACRSGVPERAQRRGVATFAMLIDRIHARLADPVHGAVFADRLFDAFPAALIDEFQDTDARQYAIFDRIYRDASGSVRGSLVMIGDPKQAIYGFRGGDIGTYLAASRQAGARYSLATNQRSARRLVDALNALYGDRGGFGTAGIDYQPVSAAGRADRKPYCIDGQPLARPLTLHLFATTDAKGGLPKVTRLHEQALDDCADDIAARLGDRSQTIDGRPLVPGDIAVLVPTNQDVIAMRRRLRERGVPCAGGGRGSVFDSEAASDLELLLHAVIDAEDERAVRAALATRLLGADLAMLERWNEQPAEFEREIERFAEWRELARRRGVLALLRAVLERRAGALLAGVDGERMLTDLRHLGELLAAEETRVHGLEGLLAWFATIRRDKGDDDTAATDARQLRIESDAARVQIATIHASKGLEYPVVYLPLAWRVQDLSGPRAPRVLRFRDDAGRLCIDLGSAGFIAHRARHHRDALDERLRLLYVALTRAVHALHVYWVDRNCLPADGRVDDAQAWEVPAIDLLIDAALRREGIVRSVQGLHEFARRTGVIEVAGPRAGGASVFRAEQAKPVARAVQGPAPQLRRFEWQHSFSSIVRGVAARVLDEAGAADEPVAADEVESSPVEDPRLSALQAWRGPRFGDAVHKLFERAEPHPLWPAQRALVEHELLAQGLRTVAGDAVAVERIARMVDRCRGADLGGGFALAALQDGQRVAEFEFQFPVNDVSIARLRELCVQHGAADVVPALLERPVLNGMLNGYIDLVFARDGRYHVLDYKTNWLGASLADYAGVALDEAMRAHHYPLQALLYTVALHRYLRQRLRGYDAARDLGHSWYLFVRALGFEPGSGVWRRHWPAQLVEALDDAFAGADEVIA